MIYIKKRSSVCKKYYPFTLKIFGTFLLKIFKKNSLWKPEYRLHFRKKTESHSLFTEGAYRTKNITGFRNL